MTIFRRRRNGRPQEGAAARPQTAQAYPQDRGLIELARWRALPPLDVPSYAQRDIQPRVINDPLDEAGR